ncbi:coronin-1A-like, partial [Diachasma alloeum]|uniref:coronin-1A-like n=1 Tax=Diachasma alloeum TaxID=454923 RepID=UPI00073840E2
MNSCSSHQNSKESRIVWLCSTSSILTTGFNNESMRQIYVRDVRHFANPINSFELEASPGVLIPLFDPDTNMLFLAGKEDVTVRCIVVTETDPFSIEGVRHTGKQTIGVSLVPKLALDVMHGEVNRVLQLTSNMVISITDQVPRK